MYNVVIRTIGILAICEFFLTVSITINYQLVEEQPPPIILGNLLDDLKLNSNSFSKSDLSINFFPMQQPGVTLFKIENFLLKAVERIDREKLCKSHTRSISKTKDICFCFKNENNCYIRFNILQTPYQSLMNLHEVNIRIVDINDNYPIFTPNFFTLRISEGSEIGSFFNIPKANDKDNIVHESITYILFPLSSSFSVVYQNNSLRIKLKETLDRESIYKYNLKVLGIDKIEDLSNTGVLTLTIIVEDINDCSPKFLDSATRNISLPETSIIGQVVYVVQVTDCDSGNNSIIHFYLNNNGQDESLQHFSINPISGEVSIIEPLDRESIQGYVLIILAKDLGSPSKTSSMTINIIVTDINDNSPIIKIDPILFISENRPIRSVLTTFTVEDYDEGDNSRVTCELLSHETHPPFSLNFMFNRLFVYTYKIETNFIFDREKKTFYNFVIHCQDNGVNNLTTDVKVLILIEDENDFSPKFTNAHNFSSISIMENTLFPNPIFKFQAIDPDIKENGKLVYSIMRSRYPLRFRLNASTGYLFANGIFDYELVKTYELEIKVEDSSPHPLCSIIHFIINIINENDNSPEIINLGDNRIFIQENISINNIIFRFHVLDRDNENDSCSADVFLVNNENHFVIMGLNLITTDYFNREQKDKFQITIIVRDKEKHQLSNVYVVDVFIEDVNDCVPEFVFPSKESTPLEISCDVSIDFVIAQISARDGDSGYNAKLSYQLYNYNHYFFMDPFSGFLKVRNKLKELSSRQIILNISVSDSGLPSLISYVSLFVNISRTPLLKSVSSRFDILLQRSSIIITFVVFVVIVCIMLIGIVLIMRRFMNLNVRRAGYNTYRSNDPNVCSGHLLIVDRSHATPERMFQDSSPTENEDSPNVRQCMMTTF